MRSRQHVLGKDGPAAVVRVLTTGQAHLLTLRQRWIADHACAPEAAACEAAEMGGRHAEGDRHRLSCGNVREQPWAECRTVL